MGDNSDIGSQKLPPENTDLKNSATISDKTVEHQRSNGDVNTTPSGNYLKDEGLAGYTKDIGKKHDTHADKPST